MKPNIRPATFQPGPIVQPIAVDELTAAAMLGISPRTLWELRRQGEIPHLKLGRLVRFAVDDLHRYIMRKREECAAMMHEENEPSADAPPEN